MEHSGALLAAVADAHDSLMPQVMSAIQQAEATVSMTSSGQASLRETVMLKKSQLARVGLERLAYLLFRSAFCEVLHLVEATDASISTVRTVHRLIKYIHCETVLAVTWCALFTSNCHVAECSVIAKWCCSSSNSWKNKSWYPIHWQSLEDNLSERYPWYAECPWDVEPCRWKQFFPVQCWGHIFNVERY